LDRVPESRERVTSRLIILAASLVGGPRTVWDYMQCSEADFLAYCAERKALPQPELERLIELIVLEQSKVIGENREILLQIGAKLKKLRGL
jgi:hypothetical protein